MLINNILGNEPEEIEEYINNSNFLETNAKMEIKSSLISGKKNKNC